MGNTNEVYVGTFFSAMAVSSNYPVWIKELERAGWLGKLDTSKFVFCPFCGHRLAVIFMAHKCGYPDID